MAQDELNKPLGTDSATTSQQSHWPGKRNMALYGLGLCLAGGAYWFIANDDGTGGRATAIAKIRVEKTPPPQNVASAKQPASVSDHAPTGSIASIHQPRSTGQNYERSSGVKVTRQGGGNVPGALIISIPSAAPRIGLVPSPDKRLIQKSRFGILPRKGRNGAKAFEVYARPLVLPGKLRNSAPRIALVIGGMGLSEIATRHAVKSLPAAVTLAFAPYGSNLQAQVTRARSDGHEVLLQVPMEPFDLAGPGPGPNLLRVAYDRKQMKERLHWHMGRFTGYIGIANFLGAKFSADPAALTPVIEELRRRGLMYFDDASSRRSLAGNISAASGTPFVRADIILDENRDDRAVDAALLKLEARAVQKGTAVGFANALPNVIARIARFTPGLAKRGIALVPASAMIGRHRAKISSK